MTELKGKVAVVTGASTGVGESVARKLVQLGMKVVGCARNEEKLKTISELINKEGPGKMFPVKCDVSQEVDVLAMFKYIKEKFGTLHVCVNNAGLAHNAPILSGDTNEWKTMFDVNVLGMCMCTREAYKIMEAAKVNDGHFVMLNSIAGHEVNVASVYCGTKFAVTALTEGLRKELRAKKSRCRVTAISPGVIKTDFITKFVKGDEKVADHFQNTLGWLKADDVADSIVYSLQSPLQMDVHDIRIYTNNHKYDD